MKARIEECIVHSPFPAAEIPCCLFYEAAKEALSKDPDKLALADGTASATRRELFVRMQRYAAGFQKHGLGPGHRVCVHLGNNVDNFVAMWACVFAGASVVLAKTSLTERELHYQLRDSDSTHILTEPAYAKKAAKAASSLQMKGFFATESTEGFVSTAEFRDLDEETFREVPAQDPRSCVLCICYTSGTTGLPKGVVSTHYGFMANIATEGSCLCWEGRDVVLVASPITHASGFIFITIGVLLGSTVVMTSPGSNLELVSQLVSKYKVTTLSILPGHLGLLVAEMQKSGSSLAGIRRISLSGGAFPETARRIVQATFSDLERVIHVYALTEAMGVVCSPSNYGTRGMDVGFPAPCSQIMIADMVTRQKLGPNQTGEICFRTPTLFKEYYKRPKDTAETIGKDGWCKTGDAGYYDEDGRLYIVQRLKEMIKCMDNQVVPSELEELILQEYSEHIFEVAVVGLGHAHYGEAPAAAVVLKENCGKKCDTEHLAKKIKATIADNLAVHKHLHGGVFFFDSLPKTDTGKVSRIALAKACELKMPHQ
uniref:Putative acyl-coa synthetase n=1 Tax=Amblyomma triste TaxID=251400 RepID=A0A023GL36_AMBTT